jgi:hypothetical protein
MYFEKETVTAPPQSSDSEQQGDSTNFANGPRRMKERRNTLGTLVGKLLAKRPVRNKTKWEQNFCNQVVWM